MLSGLSEISTLLAQNSTLFITISVIFGLLVGSFLNVVIYRMPKIMEREWRIWHRDQGRVCPHCGHKITALENIPVISYLFLRGKCSSCQAKISPRYPLIEALTGLLIGLVSWKFGYSSLTLFAWLFTFALIALTFIDFDTQL